MTNKELAIRLSVLHKNLSHIAGSMVSEDAVEIYREALRQAIALAKGQEGPEAFTLTPGLASKLASIHAHVEELFSPGGHPFDRTAISGLLEDPEVEEWMGKMRDMAMVPEFRETKTR